ncbi:MAG: hypothetical protein V1846_00220 [Candidatus Komeilibacteria bacterium]
MHTDGDLRKKIAKLIAESLTAGRQIFSVIVDYSLDLSHMMDLGSYTHRCLDTAAFDIKLRGRGKVPVVIELFPFSRSVSPREAVCRMRRVGYRPARAEELLALGALPGFNPRATVVALGTTWLFAERERVANIYRDAGRLSVGPIWVDKLQEFEVLYAAVRISPAS